MTQATLFPVMAENVKGCRWLSEASIRSMMKSPLLTPRTDHRLSVPGPWTIGVPSVLATTASVLPKIHQLTYVPLLTFQTMCSFMPMVNLLVFFVGELLLSFYLLSFKLKGTDPKARGTRGMKNLDFILHLLSTLTEGPQTLSSEGLSLF